MNKTVGGFLFYNCFFFFFYKNQFLYGDDGGRTNTEARMIQGHLCFNSFAFLFGGSWLIDPKNQCVYIDKTRWNLIRIKIIKIQLLNTRGMSFFFVSIIYIYIYIIRFVFNQLVIIIIAFIKINFFVVSLESVRKKRKSK